MRKGDILKSMGSLRGKGYAVREGEVFEVVYVDNERVSTYVCLTGGIELPLDVAARAFKKIKKK